MDTKELMILLAELREEIEYFSNTETLMVFDRIVSEHNIDPEDLK